MDVLSGAKNQQCIRHESAPIWPAWVVDLNAHFVSNADFHLVSQAGVDWDFFSYGTKLFKAVSVDDPELRKLEKLFEILDATSE